MCRISEDCICKDIHPLTPEMTEQNMKVFKMHDSQEVTQPLPQLLSIFPLFGGSLFLKKEEIDDISWKKTWEIKNLDKRKLSLMKTSEQKNQMKLLDEKISSSNMKGKSNKEDLEPEQIKELWLLETYTWLKSNQILSELKTF